MPCMATQVLYSGTEWTDRGFGKQILQYQESATCPQMNAFACVNNPMGWKGTETC